MKKESEAYQRELKRFEAMENQMRELKIEHQVQIEKLKQAERTFRTKKLITIGGHFEKLFGPFETHEEAIAKMEEVSKKYIEYVNKTNQFQNSQQRPQVPYAPHKPVQDENE